MLPTVKWYLSIILPFFSTTYLDFTGSKLIRAQAISSSRPFRIYLLPGTDVVTVVVTIRPRWGLHGWSNTRLGEGSSALNLSRLYLHVHGERKDNHINCTSSDNALLDSDPTSDVVVLDGTLKLKLL